MSNDRMTKALEMIRCAQANLENLGTTAPWVKQAAMYKVVELQLEQAAEALTGDEVGA